MKIIDRQYPKQFAIFLFFFFFAVFIVILHLLFHPIRVFGMDTSIFYMDEKYTLAAFFTTITAFLVGYLSLTNILFHKTGKVNKITDFGYGLFFLILSFDEYFEIHEYFNGMIKSGLKEKEILTTLANFSWIFPLSIIITAIFILILIKIKKAGREAKKPLFIGCLSFFIVLLSELCGSATYGKNIYLYFVAIEEGMEMIGVSFFLFATLIETENKYVK